MSAERSPLAERPSAAAHELGAAKERVSRIPAFRDRPDREHEMVMNRLVIGGIILAYLLACRFFGIEGVEQPLAVVTFYWVAGLGFLFHILLVREACPPRRIAAMVLDLGALSYGLAVGGQTTAILYPIYLWVIFGNGFRFGVRYLYAAMALGVAGFGLVLTQDNYWGEHPKLAAGLAIGLVILPLYAASLIRKLSRAKQEAENASRQKSLFLASVSHELRTPLNAIIGMSGFLEDTKLDAEQREMTRTINAAGRVLLDHINDILDFSRLEAGLMPSDIVAFDLHAVLQETTALVRAQARAKGLALTLHVDAATPHRLRGNRKHLEEVLLNLLGNAVKFTDTGHVAVTCDSEREEGGEVVLRVSVADSGIGIAPEAKARIFESFAQADESIINRYGGTGLGLAIAKQFVELNGGTISLDSTPGAGSTFRFGFRAAIDREAAGEMETLPPLDVVILAPGETAQRLGERIASLGPRAVPTSDLDAAATAIGAVSGRALLVLDPRALGRTPEAALAALAQAGVTPAASILLRADGIVVDDAVRRLFASALPAAALDGDVEAALRLAGVAGGLVALSATSREHTHARPDRPLKVLVAEDNVTNQKVIARILEREGHRAAIVADGKSALDAMIAEPFDVVLMDVNMPVMNGILAAKLYRAAQPDASRRSPIVALTADATPEARRLCEEAGMVGCVTKPIEPARLFAVLADVARAEPAGGFIHIPGPDDARAAFAEEEETAARTGGEAHDAGPVGTAAGERPALRTKTLDDLERLGGADFRDEVTSAFLGDAQALLDSLDDSVASGDAEAFRDHVHALRSSAANIGAIGIYELSLAMRGVEEDELAARGVEHVAALRLEYARVGTALVAHALAAAEAVAGEVAA
ncbi:ATP-binding protein [Salinarimonas sp. NSM]|uniref:ATP-binding protein n=1 Tax=Salinarimonas sp. NSM TaxID=3458003 RepID=UPI0040374C5E